VLGGLRGGRRRPIHGVSKILRFDEKSAIFAQKCDQSEVRDKKGKGVERRGKQRIKGDSVNYPGSVWWPSGKGFASQSLTVVGPMRRRFDGEQTVRLSVDANR